MLTYDETCSEESYSMAGAESVSASQLSVKHARLLECPIRGQQPNAAVTSDAFECHARQFPATFAKVRTRLGCEPTYYIDVGVRLLVAWRLAGDERALRNSLAWQPPWA